MLSTIVYPPHADVVMMTTDEENNDDDDLPRPSEATIVT